MSRWPLTLSSFGFAAAAGMCPLALRPWPVALTAALILALAFGLLIRLRDSEALEDLADDLIQRSDDR